MAKKALLGGLGILTVAVIVIIVLLVLQAVPLITELSGGVELEDMEFEVVGLDELEIGSLLPVAQLFIGEAAKVEEAEVALETSEVTTPEFAMTLPAGWSKSREEATANTFAMLLENADGDFATVMTVANAADPDRYMQDFVSKYVGAVERAGFAVTTYKTITARSYEAQAMDADTPRLAVRVRTWFDEEAQRIYLVVLTSLPENLSTAEAILQGPGLG